MQFGLWDQVRVDHGMEWALMLHVHDSLADHRNCTDKPSFVASSSKKVNIMMHAKIHYNIEAKSAEEHYVSHACATRHVYNFYTESHCGENLGGSESESELPN